MRNNKGFSMVEVLCVVGMISILAVASLTLIKSQKNKVFELTDEYVNSYEILDEQINNPSISEEELKRKLNSSNYEQEINNAIAETETHYQDMQETVKNIDFSKFSEEDIAIMQKILEEKGATVTWK